jgi:hypothetical protein
VHDERIVERGLDRPLQSPNFIRTIYVEGKLCGERPETNEGCNAVSRRLSCAGQDGLTFAVKLVDEAVALEPVDDGIVGDGFDWNRLLAHELHDGCDGLDFHSRHSL